MLYTQKTETPLEQVKRIRVDAANRGEFRYYVTQTAVTARKQATNRQQANTRGRIDAIVAERLQASIRPGPSTAVPYCSGRQIFSLKLFRINAKNAP